MAQAVIFRTASAVRQAQEGYRSDLSLLPLPLPRGHDQREARSAGLGDQAIEGFVVAGPTANFGKAPIAADPGAPWKSSRATR